MTTIDGKEFRRVLGHFPTGVTVVTAAPDGKPVGLTIGSFTSVSLDPPLVGFLPARNSSSWPDIERHGVFCVNVLTIDQAELCWRFAKEGDDKFEGVAWTPAPSGAPILDGIHAWMDCTIEQVVEAGDHWFVMGRVTSLSAPEQESSPMLFHKGKLGGLQS